MPFAALISLLGDGEYVAVMAAFNHPGSWSCLCRGAGFGCRLDELGHFGWAGDHGEVAGGDFDGGRAHPAGEQALGIGRDRLVLRGGQVPARQRLPRWEDRKSTRLNSSHVEISY